MPTLEESRRLVRDALDAQAREPSHAHILASLEAEIDKHNATRQDGDKTEYPGRNPERSRKLRFKDDDYERRRKRKRQSHREQRSRNHQPTETPPDDHESAHPFPREPVDTEHETAGADAAFRESLFDALADDEGAQYWESIYDQPIHVYPRPKVETQSGTLEDMSDEQYAQYVKTQMWEKKNPHVVYERERSARKRKEAEEERARERERFVRQKQQAAWERSHGYNHRAHKAQTDDDMNDEPHEYEFTGHGNMARDDNTQHESPKALTNAWKKYNQAWENLKHELLKARGSEEVAGNSTPASKRIPWPVFAGKPVTSAHIADFFRIIPEDTQEQRFKSLKAERVRWHPDKIQQRFGGRVDDGTMKTVTGVFQAVDDLLETERRRRNK